MVRRGIRRTAPGKGKLGNVRLRWRKIVAGIFENRTHRILLGGRRFAEPRVHSMSDERKPGRQLGPAVFDEAFLQLSRVFLGL